MAHEEGRAGGTSGSASRTKVWMIVAIASIVLMVVAGYLAFTYKQQVDDWEAAADETVATLQAAGIELQERVESGVAGYERQIADLGTELEQAQTEAGVATAGQAETEQQLADTQAELESTQGELESTQAALESVQAELDDATATLEQLGELVLDDGTYVGPVLSARTEPIPAVLFQDGTAWRVAEVAPDATITSGGQEFTLEEFAALLQSTDPADVALANGDYQVKVNDGVVTSIRKAQEG
jgi:hypothetical protein